MEGHLASSRFFVGCPTVDVPFFFGCRKAQRAKQIVSTSTYVRSGLNSHYFHIIIIRGWETQPNSRGLYTNDKDSLLKVG